jgi:uncharacterized protein YigA (DUF484 family)
MRKKSAKYNPDQICNFLKNGPDFFVVKNSLMPEIICTTTANNKILSTTIFR